MEMKWYTIYTKPNLGKKIADILNRKKIINFFPIRAIPAENIMAIKNNQNFNRYVFVKIYESQIAEFKRINGVINFLHWKDKPAIIEESEINLMKNFLNKYTNVKLEKKEIICEIPLSENISSQKENEGKLININNNKIKIGLPTLGYMMIGELEKAIVPLSPTQNILIDLRTKFKYRLAR
ncbi:MAG: transcription termination/antitermination NusG family protein [Ginsengibacter sp.]